MPTFPVPASSRIPATAPKATASTSSLPSALGTIAEQTSNPASPRGSAWEAEGAGAQLVGGAQGPTAQFGTFPAGQGLYALASIGLAVSRRPVSPGNVYDW